MNIVFIVGNKFKDFCNNENVITIGELFDLAQSGKLHSFAPGAKLMAGQGVTESEIQLILDTANERAPYLDLSALETRPVRASSLLTHKHLLKNSIISHPQKISDHQFTVDLMLDERSELMGDHQTGQHIQGMILIEAARQTFLAVTEEFFIGPEDHRRYYFVINGIDVKFIGFVFPIAAKLHYDILSCDIENRDRMKFTTVISVEQSGKCVTQIGVEFTAFLADKIEQKEKQQAKIALQNHAVMVQEDALAS